MLKRKLALLAAAATGVQVGAAIVASRFVVAEVPPLTLALLRYGTGFCCLLPFALPHIFKLFRPPALEGRAPSAIKRVANRDWLAMAALGVGQFAVLIALLNYGLQHISAAQAALIFSLFPLLTLLLSSALGRERISAALLAGVLLSIAGVALALWPKLQAPHPGQNWPARLLALSGQTWAVVGFIGVSSGIGYFWWLYALKHESPTRVTVFLALNPLTAAALGALLLGEALDRWTLAALGAIACGLWLATRSSSPQELSCGRP